MNRLNREQGLRENIYQFSLLVIINGFVGGMVGMERTVLPLLAGEEFNMAASTALFSFIMFFGISKSLSNYFAGNLAGTYGRKNVLVAGWVIAIPVPFILMYADHWYWIIFANVLLGINQGFAWSSTVVMKIDIAGEGNRGLAMGINESAGYLSVGLVAWLTGMIAEDYGLRPESFYIGLFLVFVGLLSSIFLVQDTHHFVKKELANKINQSTRYLYRETSLRKIFWDVTLKNRRLNSITQAGLVNNLNDGLLWGTLPILLSNSLGELSSTGLIIAVYPVVWGVGQLFTGPLGDKYPVRGLITLGMILQSIAILGFAVGEGSSYLFVSSIVLGIGTAMVYPNFLTGMSSMVAPDIRPQAIGVFRLWRDMGYVFGALIGGILVDLFSMNHAFIFVAILTGFSGLWVWVRLK